MAKGDPLKCECGTHVEHGFRAGEVWCPGCKWAATDVAYIRRKCGLEPRLPPS